MVKPAGEASTTSTGELATEPAAEVLASDSRSKLSFLKVESKLFDDNDITETPWFAFASSWGCAFVLNNRLNKMPGAEDVGVAGRSLGDLGMS